MLIDIRCQHCSKLLCRVSRDFYGVVEVVCLRCRKSNTVSLAVVLKQQVNDMKAKVPVN